MCECERERERINSKSTDLLIFGNEMMVLCGSSSPGSVGGGAAGVTTRFFASSFSCSVSTKKLMTSTESMR